MAFPIQRRAVEIVLAVTLESGRRRHLPKA
jgi:hypothetical protein